MLSCKQIDTQKIMTVCMSLKLFCSLKEIVVENAVSNNMGWSGGVGMRKPMQSPSHCIVADLHYRTQSLWNLLHAQVAHVIMMAHYVLVTLYPMFYMQSLLLKQILF